MDALTFTLEMSPVNPTVNQPVIFTAKIQSEPYEGLADFTLQGSVDNVNWTNGEVKTGVTVVGAYTEVSFAATSFAVAGTYYARVHGVITGAAEQYTDPVLQFAVVVVPPPPEPPFPWLPVLIVGGVAVVTVVMVKKRHKRKRKR